MQSNPQPAQPEQEQGEWTKARHQDGWFVMAGTRIKADCMSESTADRILADHEIARIAEEALTAIRDYEPNEVVKDDFAYDRMIESYRQAARNAISALKGQTNA
jgi:hypothetical protein